MKTTTARWGACVCPSEPGADPGLIVVKRNAPSSSVGERPNPWNPGVSGFSCVSSGWAYLPAALACQTSISASLTGLPSPSSTRPRSVIRSPGTSGPAISVTNIGVRPMRRYGPMACDAVGCSPISLLHRCVVTPTQHDVESVAQGVVRAGQLPVELRDQASARLLVGNAIEDRVFVHQGIAGEIHLRDQSAQDARAKEREMDVRGTPGVVVIAPGIGARLDGQEGIASLVVGHGAPVAVEIGIERRVVHI